MKIELLEAFIVSPVEARSPRGTLIVTFMEVPSVLNSINIAIIFGAVFGRCQRIGFRFTLGIKLKLVPLSVDLRAA